MRLALPRRYCVLFCSAGPSCPGAPCNPGIRQNTRTDTLEFTPDPVWPPKPGPKRRALPERDRHPSAIRVKDGQQVRQGEVF